MSVIGEVASIAGIISLAGQSVQAASSVYNLLKAYKRVHPRVLEIQAEIACLKETLQRVARLRARSSNPAISDLNNLDISVRKCGPILESLKIQLQPLEATSSGFFRKLLKKAKVAADVEYFSTISHQIHLCRADVSLHLDLLQSATGLVICKQIDTVTLGLDNIRESQAATSDTLSINRDEIRTDIADVIFEQRLAFSSLSSKVDYLITARPTGTAMAPGGFALMDARLKLLETQLAESMQPPKTTSERLVTQTPRGEAKVEQCLMRLINPGILSYEENGRMISELLPIDNRKAMKLDFKARLTLIRHVQCLRVLLWLMRQDNYRSSTLSYFGMIPQSCLARQAKFTSLWEFCYSYTELESFIRHREIEGELGDQQVHMASFVPWISYDHWLRYLLRRLGTGKHDGEHIEHEKARIFVVVIEFLMSLNVLTTLWSNDAAQSDYSPPGFVVPWAATSGPWAHIRQAFGNWPA